MTPVVIDLAPTINTVVIPMLSAGVLAVFGWAGAMIAAHFHFQISAGQRQLVETAIANGLALVQAKLAPGETLKADAAVAQVAGYVLPKIPGALAWLKITPDALTSLIAARLPPVAAAPAP